MRSITHEIYWQEVKDHPTDIGWIRLGALQFSVCCAFKEHPTSNQILEKQRDAYLALADILERATKELREEVNAYAQD